MTDGHGHGRRPAPCRGINVAAAVTSLSRVFTVGGSPRLALDSVDLTLRRHTVHGLLGPNGSGKTTLCKILATVLLPSSGLVEVFGHDAVADPATVRSTVGLMLGGDRGMYRQLTLRQNLRFWASLYGLRGRAQRERVAEVIEQVGLASRADDPVQSLSRGMLQRAHVARAIVSRPRLLLLDEPTSGMDVVAAHEFREFVKGLRADDGCILLTTHDMSEAEELCDAVTLIKDGRIEADGLPSELGAQTDREHTILAIGALVDHVETIRRLRGVCSVRETSPERFRIGVNQSCDTERVIRYVAGLARDVDIHVLRPSIEDVYFHVFGERGLEVQE